MYFTVNTNVLAHVAQKEPLHCLSLICNMSGNNCNFAEIRIPEKLTENLKLGNGIKVDDLISLLT